MYYRGICTKSNPKNKKQDNRMGADGTIFIPAPPPGSSSLDLLFFLDLGPGIFEANGFVEDQFSGR